MKIEELRTPPLSLITWVQFFTSALMSYGYLSFSRTYFFHLHKMKWGKHSTQHLTDRKPSVNAYHCSSTHLSNKQFVWRCSYFLFEIYFWLFFLLKVHIFFSFESVISLKSQNSQHSTKPNKIDEELILLEIKHAGKVIMHPIFQSQSQLIPIILVYLWIASPFCQRWPEFVW